MQIIGIDPGTSRSGYVVWDSETHKVRVCGTVSNSNMLGNITIECTRQPPVDIIAVEVVAGGRMVGDTTMRTAEWAGRFVERATQLSTPSKPVTVARLLRREIVKQLIGKEARQTGRTRYNGVWPKSTDAKLRRELVTRYGDDVGRCRGHEWQALACAVAAFELHNKGG
jgi:hypothetical protein